MAEERDTAVKPGDDFFPLRLRSRRGRPDHSSGPRYGSFALLRELSDNRMKGLITGTAAHRPGARFGRGQDRRRLSLLHRPGPRLIGWTPARCSRIDTIPAADSHEGRRLYGSDGRPLRLVLLRHRHHHRRQTADPLRGLDGRIPGLGLPNRDYYGRPLTDKEKYQAYVARMLGMIGWADPASRRPDRGPGRRSPTPTWTAEEHNRDETYNEFTIHR